MKSTRICPGCKWEYPWTFQGTLCTFCKTEFAEQFCNTCEVWKPSTEFYARTYPNGKTYRRKECKVCMRERKKAHDRANRDQRYARDRRFIDKRRETLKQQYDEWRERIAKLPMKPLSEQQWLTTCSYFGGCAICGNEHIETREYFIPFVDGGTYTVWNIYPMCGNCAIKSKQINNPFAKFDKYLGANTRLNMAPENRDKLVGYLQSQIEKVEQNEQKTGGI